MRRDDDDDEEEEEEEEGGLANHRKEGVDKCGEKGCLNTIRVHFQLWFSVNGVIIDDFLGGSIARSSRRTRILQITCVDRRAQEREKKTIASLD